MSENEYESISNKWMNMMTKRESYLDRAQECASLTIPALYPPDGFTDTERLTTPFQGLGARGVNNLASKLLLALFPPNSPFFRLKVEDRIIAELSAMGEPNIQSEIEASLSNIERQVNETIESSGMRVVFFEAIKHLLVAGNVLLHVPKEGIRIFRLDQYCVTRDGMGNVTEIVTKECVSEDALPPDLKEFVENDIEFKDKEEVDIWTCVHREDADTFMSYQMIGTSKEIPGTRGKHKADELPWIPLRLSAIAGESYGRSFVEEYLGDLRSLEGLTKAIVEGSTAAARLVMMVRPNGTTRRADLAKAENGAIISGHAEDVTFLQVQKFNDFRVAGETIASIGTRLASAFLLNSSVQRNAERVTAEEIRYMAQELEEALGGVYSVLAQEWQLPLLRRILARLKKSGDIPNLPKTGVKPLVVTGVEALGRGHDLNKLQIFFSVMQSTFGPQIFAQRVKVDEAVRRMLSSLGLDGKNLIKTDEEIQAENQQSMMQQAVMKGVGPVAGNVSKVMSDAYAQQAFPQQPQQ
jgi:hypothetical protein